MKPKASKDGSEGSKQPQSSYTKMLEKANRELVQRANYKGPQKKQPKSQSGNFPEYMHPVEVMKGLTSEPPTLLEGTLRINPKNYEDAFISSAEARDQDIYIKGVVSRCRALNGDIVVVKLDSPDKWKVNHEVIQDFVDMKATEKERAALMQSCVVNVKEEKLDNQASSGNIKTDSKADAAQIPVVDISDDSLDPILDPNVIKNSIDPLNDVPEASQSDYESGKSEGEEETEQELLVKMKEVSIAEVVLEAPLAKDSLPSVKETPENITTTKHSLSSDGLESDSDDVVVETSVDTTVDTTVDIDTTVGTSADTAAETTVDTSQDVSHSDVESYSSKKSRRGKRGKKKTENSSPSQVNVSSAETSSKAPARKRTKPQKPLVEFNILSVLRFPSWATQGFVQKTGVVVSIKEMKHSRLAGGYLRRMNDGNPNFFLFSPTDSRVPRMKIPASQVPADFLTRPEKYEGVMFMASLEKWDKVNMGMGKLIKSLGDSSDIRVRTEALLLESNIDYSEFSGDVLRDLPGNCDTWSVPETEVRRRRDFRDECVFTIDPATARDLDDALSVRELKNGHYMVGVHIADVSYFVRPGTTLDKTAGDRATSTYLVDRVVPMLPRPLCEKLCSLNPHEDRLTFTVEWTINNKAEVLSEWFGRTVIRSCAKLAYEDAQCLIEAGTVTGVEVAAPHSLQQVGRAVRILNDLAVKLRKRREQSGALRLDQPKLCFTLNSETGLPDGFKLHQHRDSNKMIEEFMLLANMAVARKIYSTFPRISVLRRHPDPKIDMLDKTMEQLAFLGIEVEGLTSAALAKSIDRIKDAGDEKTLACVTSLLSKPMELARYFCTGMYETNDYHHYALNVPLYTHFTSPIRRYPDILVHRLLDAAVMKKPPGWSPVSVEQVSQHCNDKRLAAKKVGEASAELFLAVFIAECGPLTQAAVVTGIMDHSVDVLVLQLGVVKRVYVDRCGVSRHGYRRSSGVSYLDMYWEDGTKLTLSILSKVEVVLTKGDRVFDFIAVIEKPDNSSCGVKEEEEVITLD